MGNSESSYPTDGYGSYDSNDDVEYNAGIIDDYSINQVIRDQRCHLSSGDVQLLRDAQWRATSELNRTMRNCELHVYLDGFNVILRSGNCSNKVIVRRNGSGQIEWKYVRRSTSQYLYDAGRGVKNFLSEAGRFFSNVASTAVGYGMKQAIGWF